jgi:hypothetical protein
MSECEHRGLFGPRNEGRTGGGARRERGARRAGRLAAPRGGAGVGMEPAGLAEEWV